MKNKTLSLVIAIAIIAIAAASVIVILNTNRETPAISLPSPPSGSGALPGFDDIDRLEVRPDTVQSVVRTMSRLEDYSRSYTLKTFWEGGSSSAEISVFKKGDKLRINQTQNGITKNTLIVDDTVSYWYSDTTELFTASLSDYSKTDADRFSGIISYEELLTLDKTGISDASYVDKLGETCIFAEYSTDDDYVKSVYISLNSGLLFASETLSNGKVVNSMETVSTDLSVPADLNFELPTKKA